MIKVGGPDTGVLSRRMRHHAEQFRPLINTMQGAILFESKIAKDDKVHRLHQSRSGPGSFGLYVADGREYHFRPAWTNGNTNGVAINILDAYKNGKVLFTLKTEAQVRRFVRHYL